MTYEHVYKINPVINFIKNATDIKVDDLKFEVTFFLETLRLT